MKTITLTETEVRDMLIAKMVKRGVDYSEAWKQVQGKSLQEIRFSLMVETKMEINGGNYLQAWNQAAGSEVGKEILADIRNR
ncbi:hypothetical protein [Cerasicoccus fimbriatus]|uniref:hypothetical protein n=1 Tax=Cerasicoccus fimbriatus TaxID=3014554 RepID=UPI0022B56B78|nr:hypothetical protein [Cerasicoccus sp. TK19100]